MSSSRISVPVTVETPYVLFNPPCEPIEDGMPATRKRNSVLVRGSGPCEQGFDASKVLVSTMCAPWSSHPAIFRDISEASAGGAVAWWKMKAAKYIFEMVENDQTMDKGP